jgi:hypothetical protein
MALRLNRVGGIAWPTREGSGHLVIPLGYLQSLGKHGQHHDHEGGGTHYLTNDVASMPNSIYSGAETHLITDRDNDSIKGMRTSAAPPTHSRPRLPSKKPHASSKNPWTGTKATNTFTSIQGHGSRTSHAPSARMGQDKVGQCIHPPPPIRELQVRVGEASLATPTTTKT